MGTHPGGTRHDSAMSPGDPGPADTETLESLRRRVAELERELSLRDEFVAAVGHELRNPLAPVLLHLHRLMSAASRAPEGKVESPWLLPQLGQFEQRLRKLLNALNRMLDASRIGTGTIELVFERVNFSELIRDTIADFERELAAAKSPLRLDIEPDVFGQWDRLRLEQIVSNLFTNAIRYGAGNPIEVTLTSTPSDAELSVRDHGIGIDQADLPRIFRRFERLHGEKFRGGFGVGLWLVDSLCSALGGSVRVTSTLGAGSTFVVRLPRSQPEDVHDR